MEDEEAMSSFVGSEGDADTMRSCVPLLRQIRRMPGEMLGRCIAHELAGLRVHPVD